MASLLELDVLPGRGSLRGAREQLASWLTEAGLTHQAHHGFLLAAWEVLINAVEHPLGTSQQAVRVEGELAAGQVVLRVQNAGAWREREAPRDGGGLGLVLAGRLVDQLELERTAQGTTVTLRASVA